MYEQHSNAPIHSEKCSLGCLDIFLISNIQNIGINRLLLSHLPFDFTNCQVFICEFTFHLIFFHIPLCNVRQPYKGCPLTCFLMEITRNETVWRMRTNNVKRVYYNDIGIHLKEISMNMKVLQADEWMDILKR